MLISNIDPLVVWCPTWSKKSWTVSICAFPWCYFSWSFFIMPLMFHASTMFFIFFTYNFDLSLIYTYTEGTRMWVLMQGIGVCIYNSLIHWTKSYKNAPLCFAETSSSGTGRSSQQRTISPGICHLQCCLLALLSLFCRSRFSKNAKW